MTDVVNLDEYRKRRIEEGTWPRDGEDTLAYWKEQLRRKRDNDPKPIPPPPPGPKKVMEQIKDVIWGPGGDHPVHPI